jgi:hypothetical protein
MLKSVVSILATFSFLASASIAYSAPSTAILLSSKGKVLVNSGDGFLPAANETKINAGSDIFVADNSSAVIHFNNGNCNVLLAAGSVTRITEASLCQETQLSQTLPQGMRGLVDDVVITPVNGYVEPPPPPVAPGFISPYAIAGGVLAIGTTAFAYSALEKSPVPPVPTSGP